MSLFLLIIVAIYSYRSKSYAVLARWLLIMRNHSLSSLAAASPETNGRLLLLLLLPLLLLLL